MTFPTSAQLEQHAPAIAILALAALVALILTWEAIAQVRRERADHRRQQLEDQDARRAAGIQAGIAAGWHDTIEIPRPRETRR